MRRLMRRSLTRRTWKRFCGLLRSWQGCRPLLLITTGQTARSFLRRRPVRIVEGRSEGGYTSVFEVICCECGDNPYLDYSEVSARLQRLRGPHTLRDTLRDGLAAYQRHLGLTAPDSPA